MTSPKDNKKSKIDRGVSAVLGAQELLEMVYLPEEARCEFLHWMKFEYDTVESCLLASGRELRPFSPQNTLIEHEVVLFPSAAEEYGTREMLLGRVRSFIHSYVDVSPEFEEIAANYVLFTWVFDQFDEVPYLRVRGDVGSGKSRFLKVVGSICYKPIFASAASTVSPIFRILDAVRGVLVLDEGDFRFSDERAEIVKILNNGNSRGFPVLRTEQAPSGEYSPRAFAVYGPKLIATRRAFEDRALESRCLTEHLGTSPPRPDIPINLPAGFEIEARSIRNQLLLYRFRTYGTFPQPSDQQVLGVEPRIAQIFAPLLCSVSDESCRKRLEQHARRYSESVRAERASGVEALLLTAIQELRENGDPLLLKSIAGRVSDLLGGDRVTSRWVGYVLRSQLGITARKSHGNFRIDPADFDRIDQLTRRFGESAKDRNEKTDGA